MNARRMGLSPKEAGFDDFDVLRMEEQLVVLMKWLEKA